MRKKLLALVTAAAIATSMLAMPVFAAPVVAGGLDTVELGGASATIGIGDSVFDEVVDGAVTLTSAQAASAGTAITTGAAAKTFKAVKVAKNDVAGVSTSAVLAATLNEEVAATTWADGDYLMIAVSLEDNAMDFGGAADYYMIKVNVPADGDDTPTNGGTIGGDSKVEAITWNVVVPTSLDFAINPFEIGNTTGDDNQINSPNFVVVNKTIDVPVLVSFDLKVTGTEAAGLVSAGSVDLKPYDITATDKKFALSLVAALSSGASIGGITYANPTGAAITVDYDNTNGVAFNTSGKAAEISFFLDSATTPAALATSDAGVGIFQIYGRINAYADWKDDDLNLTGTYTFSGVPKGAVDAIETVEGTLNQFGGFNGESDEGDEGDEGDSATPWYEESAKAWTGALPATGQNKNIDFDAKGGTIKVTSNAGTVQPPSAYAYNESTKILTINASKLDGAPNGYILKVIVESGPAAGTYTLTFTAS